MALTYDTSKVLEARKLWRLEVVKFAEDLLKGDLANDVRFQKKVFRNLEDGCPCLDRLGPPRFDRLYKSEHDLHNLLGKIERLETRLVSMRALQGKKLRMGEDRFRRYVLGESL